MIPVNPLDFIGVNAGDIRASWVIRLDFGHLPVYDGASKIGPGGEGAIVECGVELAERLLADLLAAQGYGLPRDIGAYCRVSARCLAGLPPDRARAVVARLSVLGGPPSRAEIAAACGDAGGRDI
jgi:hypothetical protein